MALKPSLAKTFMTLSVQFTADPYDNTKSIRVAELFNWTKKYTTSIIHLPQTNPGEYPNSVLYFPDGSAMTVMAAYPEDRIDLLPGTSTSNFQDPSRVTIKPEGPAAETYFSYMRLLQAT